MPPLRRRLWLVAALLFLTACAASRPPRGIVDLEDPYGAVAAEVVDAETGEPLAGAALWIPGSDAMNADTVPMLARVSPGRWTVHADAPGYEAAETRVVVAERDTARARFALRRRARVPAPPGVVVIRGLVFNPQSGNPVGSATVYLMPERRIGAVTHDDGSYRLVIPVERLRGASHLDLRASRLGMATQRRAVPVRPGEEVAVDFRIAPQALH